MKKVITIFLILLITILSSCKKTNSTEVENKSIKQEKIIDGKFIRKIDNGNTILEGYMVENERSGLWKYYDKKKRLNKVERYNKDSLLFVLDKNDYVYKELYLEKIEAYIPIPSKWELNTNHEDQTVLFSALKSTHKSNTSFSPTMFMNYEKLDNASFDEYVVKEKDNLIEKTKNLNVINFKKNKTNKHESYRMFYLTTVNKTQISGVVIWTKVNDKVVIFNGSCSKQEFQEYILLFLEVGNSLTRKETTS